MTCPPIRTAVLSAAFASSCLLMACSNTTEPEGTTVLYYEGFTVDVTPDGFYLGVQLDHTWDVPDSATALTPKLTLLHMTEIQRSIRGSLQMYVRTDTLVSGDYALIAFYGSTRKVYAEHLRVSEEVSTYDFASIWPPRGASDLDLTPTIRWCTVDNMQAFLGIYTEPVPWPSFSDPPVAVFSTQWTDSRDSLQVPVGVLEPGIAYYWRLVFSEINPVLERVPGTDYGYMDLDSFIVFAGAFSTADRQAGDSYP